MNLITTIITIVLSASMSTDNHPSTNHDTIPTTIAFQIKEGLQDVNLFDLERDFRKYAASFHETDYAKLSADVDSLMKAAETNPIVYRTIYRLAGECFYDRESPLYDEESYILFLKNVTDSNILPEADRERAKFRLYSALKNRPGNKASDFSFISRNGNDSRLYDISTNGMLILLFYDPDCNHCDEIIAQLKATSFPDNLTIAAIDPQDDRQRWDSTKHSLPEKWIVGFTTDPIEDSDLYIFDQMPSIYLLDTDKKVILKDTTIHRILQKLADLQF